MDENAFPGVDNARHAQLAAQRAKRPPVDRAVLEMLDNANIDSPVRERLLGMHKKAIQGSSPVRFSAKRALRALNGGSPARRRKHSRYAPEAYAALLRSPLPLARLKCLRAAIASESQVWVTKFLAAGAYDAIVHRIEDICALGWREESHEAMLHELVRCVLALATSEPGRKALVESIPRPFVQLAELLFHGLRPSSLATRRHIVECLLLLSRLDVPAAGVDEIISRVVRDTNGNALAQARVLGVPRGAQFALALLHSVSDAGDMVAFLQVARPRVLRLYVKELDQTCSEFFWVFCHPENAVWDADCANVAAARAPRAPDSMTAGVEWEAMAYITAHLRLLNAFADIIGHTEALSDDLVESGIVPVLDTLRKSSQTYYAELHAELACLARWLAPKEAYTDNTYARTTPASLAMLAPAAPDEPAPTIRHVRVSRVHIVTPQHTL
ncbi:hypothetical protein MCUN1_001511 [Malassezia cuniculi]|uniref:Formin GTPase-binding domain-containing protein n=1 Tax=Malassezia cuniculi TaxID=948313 RepID=A0AAF0ESY1_9BASI|nr:hypothetical protein MCUN1_001511 [Malassezia cuniculi]